ncbi:MAG TPA: hypothetical protein VGM93_05160 [Acidimicrobiales bacterium]
MLLAELEVFQSRPIAPTRRMALGITVLPTTPPPGFGGLLLGGIAAAFVDKVDPDLLGDLGRLTHQLEQGLRIPQPRLRHRFQADRVGLNKYCHRLIGTGEELLFDLDHSGSPAPQLLGAVYAAGRLPVEVRPRVFDTIRRGLRWQGPIDAQLIEHLSGYAGTRTWSALGGVDPVSWAMSILGFDDLEPNRRSVQRHFRDLLRAAHPDHGAEPEGAAQRINDLTEARRILLAD